MSTYFLFEMTVHTLQESPESGKMYKLCFLLFKERNKGKLWSFFEFCVLIFTLKNEPGAPPSPPLPLPPTCDVHACSKTGMYIASWGKGEKG